MGDIKYFETDVVLEFGGKRVVMDPNAVWSSTIGTDDVEPKGYHLQIGGPKRIYDAACAREALDRFEMRFSPIDMELKFTHELEIHYNVRDRDGGKWVELCAHQPIPFGITEDEFFALVRDTVFGVFIHEAREAIHVDGKRRYEPIEEHR